MATDGISRLISRTQLILVEANDAAAREAELQRKLKERLGSLRGDGAVEKQKFPGAQRTLEVLPRGQRRDALVGFTEFPRVDQQGALTELRMRLQLLRQTLSPAAAALLDQWIEWASERR